MALAPREGGGGLKMWFGHSSVNKEKITKGPIRRELLGFFIRLYKCSQTHQVYTASSSGLIGVEITLHERERIMGHWKHHVWEILTEQEVIECLISTIPRSSEPFYKPLIWVSHVRVSAGGPSQDHGQLSAHLRHLSPRQTELHLGASTTRWRHDKDIVSVLSTRQTKITLYWHMGRKTGQKN